MAGKTLFIVNPTSGSSSRRKQFTQFSSHLLANPDYNLVETEYRGHARGLATHAKALFQTIVAVGGDGTINEVVSGILGSDVILGIMPLGSGNGLAYHLGIPHNFTDALRVIEEAEPKPIDIIWVNDRIVINVGGIGFDGHVAKLFNSSAKRGLMAYIRLILRELINFKEFEYGIEAPNLHHKGKAFIIAIANGSEFGNRFKIAPIAKHNDGKLVLVIIRKPPFFKLIQLFVHGYQGKLAPSKYYQTHILENAALTFDNSVAHVDGEIDEKVLSSPLRTSVKKGGIRVYY
jgi:YegS/Rv2252/BmrU family lipid kinase